MMSLKARLKRIDQLVTDSRRRYAIFVAWRSLTFVLTACGIAWLLTESLLTSLLVASVVIAISVIWLLNSKHWRAFHRDNYLAFLNLQYPQLENSAQLLVEESSSHGILQRLQSNKIGEILEQLAEHQHSDLYPHYPIKQSQLACGVILVVFALLIALQPMQRLRDIDSPPDNVSSPRHNKQPAISEVLVSAISPQYTQLADIKQTGLDLTLISGASVTWLVTATNIREQLALHFSNGEKYNFKAQGNNVYQLTITVDGSQVYQLVSASEPLTKLHSIAVTRDEMPKVRVISPSSTITEFSKNAQPQFDTKAQVSDDFGIAKVDILASVAKGSGEAVKFRDHVFEFDSSEQRGPIFTLKKSWLASDLGMEPGDELYFTVRAWDNKQPTAQLSRSQTKIFRWLDDDQKTIVSEGILVDFMPEYFKSQRQIIIETQQLIADEPLLTEQEFEQTSRSLGYSQSDLKLKYGQYLGDEFDDGRGGHQMEAGPGAPQVHTKDGDHSDDDHAHQEDAPQIAAGNINTSGHADDQHAHESSVESQTSNDKSGYEQVIAQYGHNHGDTDVGVMGTQSPQALMKRAIANMWDAELHLMLSAPRRALPYEQEALKYLNQAQKAQRVYVKRLGFEPPPVTEKRRYQGDLSDILSYQRQHEFASTDQLKDDLQVMLSALSRTVHTRAPAATSTYPASGVSPEQSLSTSIRSLTPEQLESVNRLKQFFNQQAQSRPALIRYVTILQQIQQEQSLVIQECQACLTDLHTELWRQKPTPVAAPFQPRPNYSSERIDIGDYRQFLSTKTNDGGQRK